MEIFYSAGEPSGDVHAANLIRSLRAANPNVRAVGYGGPKMREAGCRLHAELTQLAVMWFLRVLLNIHKFVGLYWRADRYFAEHRPDAVVLIDYPGFNWWIAKAAQRNRIPVFYYSPPQVWAWGRWRVEKMRTLVDHVLSGLPFEQKWLAQRGCQVTYVGHPFFDEVRSHAMDQAFVAAERAKPGPLVTILPGSRNQELEKNLRFMLAAAARIKQAVPGVRFAAACFKPEHADMVRAEAQARDLPIEVHHGRTPELIAAAHSCLAVSGSVSLELLYHGKPTVVVYWVDRLAFHVQDIFFRKCKYITLVNLLAEDDTLAQDRSFARPPDELLYPEYLTWRDPSADLARHIVRWLNDPAAHAARIAELAALRDRVGQPGAAEKAARIILSTIDPRSTTLRGPHHRVPAASSSRRARH